MTREEAIEILRCVPSSEIGNYSLDEISEALTMAIEALQKPPISQRSMYQAGYKQGREEALKREPSEDGTLEVKVEDATKVGRVLISDDKHRGGLYYPDEDEPKGDLISRAEAIEALGEEPPVWCDEEYEIAERDQWRADIEAIKSVPSADRPKGEWIHTPNGIDRDFVWWTCSECGHKIFSETEKDRIEFHAYCGRCGADMRGEDE